MRQLLLSRPHRDRGGHVFLAFGGGRLDADKVLKVLKRDVIGPLKEKFPSPEGEIGFQYGTVHSLRHFFVTEAFLGGASDSEVRDWVGHRDSRIVERYRHLRSDAAKQTMERLNFLGTATREATAAEDKPEQDDMNNQSPHKGEHRDELNHEPRQ